MTQTSLTSPTSEGSSFAASNGVMFSDLESCRDYNTLLEQVTQLEMHYMGTPFEIVQQRSGVTGVVFIQHENASIRKLASKLLQFKDRAFIAIAAGPTYRRLACVDADGREFSDPSLIGTSDAVRIS